MRLECFLMRSECLMIITTCLLMIMQLELHFRIAFGLLSDCAC